MQCKLCGDESKSAVHVHCECPVYATIKNPLMKESDNPLGRRGGGGVNALNKFKRIDLF